MKISESTAQSIYVLRLTPIIKKIIKKKKWKIKEDNFQVILRLTVEKFYKFKPDDFIGLTDEDILYEIYRLFESGPLADYLFSLDGLLSKRSNYDIRHKETLRLFLKEYFELFFPEMATTMNFDSVIFMDKELIALFGGEHRITDALILIEITVKNESKWIMIHWEQQSNREPLFEERMFHCFCGIYFQYRKLIFPIAMFTDTAKWEKPIPKNYKLKVMDHLINEYHYKLIKLKNYKANEFEKRAQKHPLAYAYLPLTDYDNSERLYIKAKAVNGVLKNFPDGTRRASLISLIDELVPLNKDEKKEYNKLINDNLETFKEVYMFKSVEDYLLHKGREEGREEGKEEGREETLIRLIEAGLLTGNKVMQATALLGIKNTLLDNKSKRVHG